MTHPERADSFGVLFFNDFAFVATRDIIYKKNHVLLYEEVFLNRHGNGLYNIFLRISIGNT